jgi:hypothetical protein
MTTVRVCQLFFQFRLVRGVGQVGHVFLTVGHESHRRCRDAPFGRSLQYFDSAISIVFSRERAMSMLAVHSVQYITQPGGARRVGPNIMITRARPFGVSEVRRVRLE